MDTKIADDNELFIIKLLKQKGDNRKLENFIASLRELKERAICCNSYPVWLAIDTTNMCTLKCPFCPTGFGNIRRPKGMMGLEDFKKIIDMLGPYLLHIDMQNWGEPLLHKDIYSMISYAKKFDIHITLSTNFQNFSEKSSEELLNSKLDRLILSIDGASQETYEKYRRGGDFFKAVENIKILINKRRELKSRLPTVIWQFLVFRHNEHEIEIARRVGKELGVDDVGINPAFIAVDSEEYRDWIPWNSKYSRYSLLGEAKAYSGSDSFLKDSAEKICNWLWQGITINWDGTVSPCCGVYLEEEDFGNIFEHLEFLQLWNNCHYRAAREFMKDRVRRGEYGNNTCLKCNKIGQINVDINPDFWIRDVR